MAGPTVLDPETQRLKKELDRALEALAESQQRFRAVFEQAPIGMAVADVDGYLQEANTAFCRMVERSPAELAGLRWEDLLEPGQPALNLARLLGTILPGPRSPTLQTDARFRSKRGKVLDVEWSLCVVRDAKGQPVCQIGQTADISRRKQAERKLKQYAMVLDQSNQDLQHFASVASHDLQEPLRMVNSYLELLARRYRGRIDADADEFIGYALEGASRMQKLIRGLLEFSRVSARGKAPAAVDAGASFSAALENLRVAVEESGADVSHGPLPVVVADELQLTQLFQNLVSNSIKFRGPEAPRVRLEAHRALEFWEFRFIDNGIGLDPKYSDQAFRIFQRLHPQSRYPGAGIGLALCKRIVERHGGRIWVEPRAEQGTDLRFTLPAESEAVDA